MVRTSPRRVADPDGMLSVHISQPVTATGQEKVRERRHRGQDGPGARHVVLHLGVAGVRGFSAMPPESYMMPLPTRPRCAVGSPAGR